MMRDCKRLGVMTALIRKTGIGRVVRTTFTIILLSGVLWSILLAMGKDSVFAENTDVVKSGDYKYRMLENGTAELCGYVGAGGAITVPAKIDGKAVSRLGEGLFENNDTITKVEMEYGIKEVGKGCLYNCKALLSVDMPDSIEVMESWIFAYDSKLIEVTLPKNITNIPTAIFESCSSLKKIEIPDKVEKINSLAFCDCSSLSELFLPDSVVVIGDGVFLRCLNLQRIRISPKIEVIENGAFQDTKKLRWITNIDWRKVQTVDYMQHISVLIKQPYMILKGYAFDNSLLNQGIVIGNTNKLNERVFSPSTVLYGKPGSEVQKYASANNQMFKEYIQVERITLNHSNALLSWNQNNTLQLSPNVIPSSATVKQVGYYSSNPRVAVVDGKGCVKVISEGEAEITAVSLDSASITTHCKIIVTTALQEIKLSKTTMTIYPGKSNGKHLTVATSPKNTKGYKVSWSSSNSRVATVGPKGMVIGERAGIATITAKSGNKKVSCKVIVRPASVKGFTMQNQTTSSINIKWKAVVGITGYSLYGYNIKTKKYQTICQLRADKTAYQIKCFPGKKALLSGTAYTLYLKPYKLIGKTRYYGKGIKLYVATKPDKVSITGLKRIVKSKTKGFKIEWKKVKGVSGYQVYVSTDKGRTYKKVAVIKDASHTSFQFNKAKRKTTYFIRIKAYKKAGGKVIGGAKSRTRSIRIY